MTPEKSSDLPTHVSTPERSKSRPVWAYTALVLLGYHICKHISLDVPHPDSTVSNGITWWPCPDITTTECAYLTVPRDYANPEPNDTVSIFMRKVPATVSSKDYLGSILINPGGPGGSGNIMAATAGFKLRDIVGGRYDIIGFDPRGVNMTTPKLGCYENEALGVHSLYKQTLMGAPYDARGSSSLPAATRAQMELAYLKRLNASFTAYSRACLEHGNRPMLESVSTSYVVQDMERIVDALGEDGLNFWGFSYGTVLGSTFAAMRPQLVKRMILDGVVDSVSYYNDIWRMADVELVDSTKTLKGFFDSCAEAGPDRCAFAKSPSGEVSTEGAQLHSRLEALYSKLRDDPIPVSKSATGPGILTASELKQVIAVGLYSPSSWPGMAEAIAEAEAGKPQLLYDRVYGSFAELKPGNDNDNIFNRYMERSMSLISTISIMCSDAKEPVHKSLDEYAEYIHETGKLSPIAETFTIFGGLCQNWKIRAGQRYDGPWSLEEGLQKTRFPILYASLDADPVTPLAAAQKMVRSFGNQSAALLVQEGFGHCTISHPSLCTARAVRDYFLKGKVPAAGTHCKPEPGHLFPGNGAKPVAALSTEDQKLWDALKDLGGISSKFRHHL